MSPNNYGLSFWEADALLPEYDLVVIGAGPVGLSSALFYSRQNPGSKICVLEKGYLPEGAGTRNAGFACFGSATEIMEDLKQESCEEVTGRMSRRYHGLRLLETELGAEGAGFAWKEGFEIFTDESLFQSACDFLPDLNGMTESFSGENAAFRPGRINGYRCIVNSLEGTIHPGKMIRTLCDRVQRSGAEIRFNTPVKQIETGTIILETGRKLTTRRILVATNGFASRLLPGACIEPARGYVFVTSPLADNPWKGTFHFDRGFIYFRDLENRLLLGGARNLDPETERTDEPGINPVIKHHLTEFAESVLNLGKGWTIDYEWTGVMGFGETKSPLVGEMHPQIYIAAGFAGMGIALGMQAAREVVGIMT